MATQSLLAKPLQGGAFGAGEYELASMSTIDRGLHRVQYLVIQRRAGLVVSVADDKQAALAGARKVIGAANDEAPPQQAALWSDEELPRVPESTTAPSPVISRRRREIFDRSKGQCHYCQTPLALDGKWHVEHMLPRALGGNDEPMNLVAACVPCNLRKSDRTAIEFMSCVRDEQA